jgi:hypothetical protein
MVLKTPEAEIVTIWENELQVVRRVWSLWTALTDNSVVKHVQDIIEFV